MPLLSRMRLDLGILPSCASFAPTTRSSRCWQSTVLSYAVDPLGKVAGNPCEGIKRLYKGDRSEIIWTDADIDEFKTARSSKGKAACPPELVHAVDLAAHTGLRLGDLIRLCWSHIGDHAIVLSTGTTARGHHPPLRRPARDPRADTQTVTHYSDQRPMQTVDAKRTFDRRAASKGCG